MNLKDTPKKVTIFWNDQKIDAIEGANLLNTLLNNGVEITHYCSHKGLSNVGACRMCLFSIEGDSTIRSACDNTVEQNVRYYDNTPEVMRAKKFNLLGMLNRHTVECNSCLQSGDCVLQKDYKRFVSIGDKKIYDGSWILRREKNVNIVNIGKNVIFE